MSSEVTAVSKFSPICAIDRLNIGTPTQFELDGRPICLLRTDEDVIAFEDRCPHRGHPLSEGKCVDGILRCALHGWEYSIPEGEAVSPRAPFTLELLELRIEDGRVGVVS